MRRRKKAELGAARQYGAPRPSPATPPAPPRVPPAAPGHGERLRVSPRRVISRANCRRGMGRMEEGAVPGVPPQSHRENRLRAGPALLQPGIAIAGLRPTCAHTRGQQPDLGAKLERGVGAGGQRAQPGAPRPPRPGGERDGNARGDLNPPQPQELSRDGSWHLPGSGGGGTLNRECGSDRAKSPRTQPGRKQLEPRSRRKRWKSSSFLLLLPRLLSQAQQAETARRIPRRCPGTIRGEERPRRPHSQSPGTASSSGCDRGRKRRRRRKEDVVA